MKNWISKLLNYFGYYKLDHVEETVDLLITKTDECEALLSALTMFENRDIDNNQVLCALMLGNGLEEFRIKNELSKQIVYGNYRTSFSQDSDGNLVLTVVIDDTYAGDEDDCVS